MPRRGGYKGVGNWNQNSDRYNGNLYSGIRHFVFFFYLYMLFFYHLMNFVTMDLALII